jgi:hypothetical protein
VRVVKDKDLFLGNFAFEQVYRGYFRAVEGNGRRDKKHKNDICC